MDAVQDPVRILTGHQQEDGAPRDDRPVVQGEQLRRGGDGAAGCVVGQRVGAAEGVAELGAAQAGAGAGRGRGQPGAGGGRPVVGRAQQQVGQEFQRG
ncbi:hypothetical protein R2F25_18020 [Streptomyces sp. UP1A-1]|nr:hypothetical protein [Streptomyces sp. UP1A-1]